MPTLVSIMRAHVQAVFRSDGGLPAHIDEQQRRLETAIRDARLGHHMSHILHSLADHRSRADEPFELFVLGEGKFGKSTLVNALLGYRIAPTDFTPKTWCFNRYVATDVPAPDVRVFVSEELRERQECNHLRQWLSRPVGSFRGLEEYRVGQADALQLAEEEENRVRATHNRPDAYWSPIMEMEWTVPADRAIVPGIRLVDTMGINQDVAVPKSHQHYLRWQYERADAVLWLVSYDRLNAAATRTQLLEARRYAKVVYLLITRWDKAANKECLAARAEELYGSLCSAVLPISALAALATQGLLAEPTSRDEREFAAKCRGLGPEALRELSGFDALSEALQRFLDGRQRTIRNAQMYSALRQKGREFRRVATQVREDARANIALFRELQARLREVNDRCTQEIQEHLNEALERWLGEMETRLAQLTFVSRHSADALMGADRVDGEFRQIQESLALQIEQQFAGVVQWAASSERCYKASEFGPTGAVEAVALTASVAVPEVRLDITCFSPTRFEPPPPSGFLDMVVGALQSAWDWLLSMLNSEHGQDELNKLRNEIRVSWTQELERAVRNARLHLVSEVSQICYSLGKDFEQQYNRSGGDIVHQTCIDRISAVLDRPIVEPVLISVPLRLMRHYRWRN